MRVSEGIQMSRVAISNSVWCINHVNVSFIGIKPGELDSYNTYSLGSRGDQTPEGTPASSPATTPYDGYLSGSESGPGPDPVSPLDGGEGMQRIHDQEGVMPSPEQSEEEIFRSLSFDFGIHPDDSDMVKMMKLMLQDSLSVVVSNPNMACFSLSNILLQACNENVDMITLYLFIFLGCQA